jgi:hypothetical protein
MTSQPRASFITEALRACTVRVVGPHPDDDASWAQLERRITLLADDLAIAIDDRPNVCHQCGAPCASPALVELAAVLRPDRAEPTTDSDRPRRIARVLWVLGSLLGQCERHGIPFEILLDNAEAT